MKRRSPSRSEYSPESQTVSKPSRLQRFKQGADKALSAVGRNVRGFASDVKQEGIRSGYKTNSTLVRSGRNPPRYRTKRTHIIQHRPVMPDSPSLGERAVSEASEGYVPHMDREFTRSEDKDFFGPSKTQELVSTGKKNQRYY